MMKFVSTTGNGPQVSFREAVLSNLPNDGGLYFPTEIPQLESGLLEEIPRMELDEVAFNSLRNFCEGDIEPAALSTITKRVFHFPIPLQQVSEKVHSLELFHGPTYAFKDIGARFLAECLSYFNAGESKERTVLVATSGDTGGAVANGLLGVEGVRVVILYPKGKVSELQEKQLTTLGRNISALEVEGTFDDCQRMVKKAFADKELIDRLQLTSANSINVARWIPQSIYYYVPFQQGMKNAVIAIPSGNYGNLTSGVLASRMGIPIDRFIAASNANDTVPRYLHSGSYDPKETIATVANAMDVADPSNFSRLLSLFHHNYDNLITKISPFTLLDQRIKEVIRQCKEKHDYLLDPHSAIGLSALENELEGGIFLGTAHYCKFLPTMNEALDSDLQIPSFASDLMKREKNATAIKADFAQLREFVVGE